MLALKKKKKKKQQQQQMVKSTLPSPVRAWKAHFFLLLIEGPGMLRVLQMQMEKLIRLEEPVLVSKQDGFSS